MRILTPVVERAALAMFHSGEHLALGGPAAFELIRDEHPWHVRELLEQLAAEFLRGAFVPPTLHENIEDIPIMIDSAPQIVALTMDRQKHLIERLCIPRSRTSMSQFVGIVLSELDAPLAHGFTRDDDSPGEQPLFDLATAQAKAAISPDHMADDLSWEPVMRVWVGRRDTHIPSMAHPAGADKPLNKLTIRGIPLRGSCARLNDFLQQHHPVCSSTHQSTAALAAFLVTD
jgi:hypothetical protein